MTLDNCENINFSIECEDFRKFVCMIYKIPEEFPEELPEEFPEGVPEEDLELLSA